MAVKYHISPESGRANICRAAKGACPIGGDHYDSKDEARAGYEKAMEAETVSAPVSKKGKNYASPFKRTEQVKGATVWAYADIMSDAGGKRKLEAANPGITFTKGKDGELIVAGPANKVEAYIQEPGGAVRDIAKSLSNLQAVATKPAKKPSENKSVKEEAVFAPTETGPRFNDEGEALPDENLLGDWEASGGWNEPDEAAINDEDVPDIDDDFSDIKCDDCGHPLSSCTCDSNDCEYCGAYDVEKPSDHYDDCTLYRPEPKAYSWE